MAQPADAGASCARPACPRDPEGQRELVAALARAQDRDLHGHGGRRASCPARPGVARIDRRGARRRLDAGGGLHLGRGVGAGGARARGRQRAGGALRAVLAGDVVPAQEAGARHLRAGARAARGRRPTRRSSSRTRATACRPRVGAGLRCVVTVSGYTARRGLQRGGARGHVAWATRTASRTRVLANRGRGAARRLGDAGRPRGLPRGLRGHVAHKGGRMSAGRRSSRSSWWCGRWRRRPSTTRRTSATSTRWSATGTSATRWRGASRSSSREWDDLDRDGRRRPSCRRSARRSSPAGSAARRARSGARRSCAPAARSSRRRTPSAPTRPSRCCAPRSRASSSAASSDVGDKTLLDALVPATDALEQRLAGRRRRQGRARGRRGDGRARRPRPRRPMLAKRGRAAYTGERSIGTRRRRGGRRRGDVRARRRGLARGLGRRRGSQAISRKGGAVKKFVNDPQAVRAGDAQGHRAREPGHAASTCPSTT